MPSSQNPNIKPKNRRNYSLIFRRISQIGFFGFIIVAALRHNLAGETTGVASLDALCPFGGLETLWQLIATGKYVPKTHPANIVLGLGVLVGAVLAGAAFCGWICPFGTLQDALTGLRKRLRLPEMRVPRKLDVILRYGRFVVLGLILYQTIATVKLWFSSYDPYRTIFSLEWIFTPNLSEHWPAYLIAVLVLLASFFIPRAWCKYACPLGGVMSIVGHTSLLRIRRDAQDCKGCRVCETPCPIGIAVAQANPRINTNCIGCLECVEACPRHASLQVKLRPSWLDGILALVKRLHTAKGIAQ